MSRLENMQVMGYFAIEERHDPPLFSEITPATPAPRLEVLAEGGLILWCVYRTHWTKMS